MNLPMFPLGGVHFPFSVIPLRVFEDRYLQLLDDVIASDGRFGVVLIERGFEVGGGDVRFDVGTLAEVRTTQEIEDGHRAVIAVGLKRIRIDRWLPEDPYPMADVTVLEEEDDPAGVELLATATGSLHRLLAVASELGADTGNFAPDMGDDPVVAGFHLAQMLPIGPLDAQQLLAEDSSAERLRQMIRLLDEEVELIKLRLAEG
ncbi:MAG: LON peptidase substrate-binding domain-containing protein [Acidimicrobiia bacterium]